MSEIELKLYIAGSSPRSKQAIESIQELCDGELKGRCALTVIDVLKHPQEAINGEILATPTLVKESPQPSERIFGHMSDHQKIIDVLRLK